MGTIGSPSLIEKPLSLQAKIDNGTVKLRRAAEKVAGVGQKVLQSAVPAVKPGPDKARFEQWERMDPKTRPSLSQYLSTVK